MENQCKSHSRKAANQGVRDQNGHFEWERPFVIIVRFNSEVTGQEELKLDDKVAWGIGDLRRRQ